MMSKTRTSVHSPSARRQQRSQSEASAWRALVCVQFSAQLLVWSTLFAYDRSQQAAWQAMLMLLLPMLAVYAVWKQAAHHLAAPAGRWAPLALLPCLILDAALLLCALRGLILQEMPQAPAWLGTAVPSAACLAAALCARPRGVRYGALCLRGLLLLLFVCGTFFLRSSTRVDRLWPLMGRGLPSTAYTALMGSGAVWGVSLLFVLPKEDALPSDRPSAWMLAPWLLACVWMLWFGLLRPWAPGDELSIGQKLTALPQNASSVLTFELAGLMWLLLLPLSLTACLTAGETLVRRAWRGCPRMVPLLAILLPGALLLLLLPDRLPALLGASLPFRWVLSLLSGAAICFLGRRA